MAFLPVPLPGPLFQIRPSSIRLQFGSEGYNGYGSGRRVPDRAVFLCCPGGEVNRALSGLGRGNGPETFLARRRRHQCDTGDIS